jgi:hypothetical protein
MQRSGVDFPQPEGPTMLTSSLCATIRFTPEMAVCAAGPRP